MERAFSEMESGGRPLQAAITNAVTVFQMGHEAFCKKAIAAGVKDFHFALFTFWGYDDRKDCFFGLSWRSSGTNDGVFHPSFDSRTQVGQLYIQGDSDFLSAFVRNHNNLPTIGLPEGSKRDTE